MEGRFETAFPRPDWRWLNKLTQSKRWRWTKTSGCTKHLQLSILRLWLKNSFVSIWKKDIRMFHKTLTPRIGCSTSARIDWLKMVFYRFYYKGLTWIDPSFRSVVGAMFPFFAQTLWCPPFLHAVPDLTVSVVDVPLNMTRFNLFVDGAVQLV